MIRTAWHMGLLPRSRVALLAVLAGCTSFATGGKTRSFIASPAADGSIRRVAVLPLLHDSIPPDSGAALAALIADSLLARNRGLEILRPPETRAALDTLGLLADWEEFLAVYQISGIPDAGSLLEIGDALGVDALLYPEVSLFAVGRWVHSFGPLTTYATVRLWLFECSAGRLAWELVDDRWIAPHGIAGDESWPPLSAPVHTVARRAVEQLARRLPPVEPG